MPQYKFICPKCNFKKSKLNKDSLSCPKCNETMERNPSGASSQAVERLDNGLMPKAVERIADAERLYKERANKDPANNNG